MRILIESDRDISELSIKFSEGEITQYATQRVDGFKKKENLSSGLKIDEKVDLQAEFKSEKKREPKPKQSAEVPKLDIPDTSNREVLIDPGMSETF